jgi:hypothetical protein
MHRPATRFCECFDIAITRDDARFKKSKSLVAFFRFHDLVSVKANRIDLASSKIFRRSRLAQDAPDGEVALDRERRKALVGSGLV